MNKRKLIGLVASVMVAGLGTLVLLKYANSSKTTPQAAVAEPTVPVLKVQRLIVKGTPAEQIRDAVTVEQIPVSQKLSDAADNVDLLTGLVASTDLLPNEQVVKARFIPAAEQRKQEIGSGAGLIGVWITLDPIRALNGADQAQRHGRRVRLVHGRWPEQPGPDGGRIRAAPTTHLVLHKVPVLDVVGAVQLRPPRPQMARPLRPPRPPRPIQVKLGVDAASAERLGVSSASFGQIYLGSEDLDVSEEGTKIVDRANSYEATAKVAPVLPPNTDVVGTSATDVAAKTAPAPPQLRSRPPSRPPRPRAGAKPAAATHRSRHPGRWSHAGTDHPRPLLRPRLSPLLPLRPSSRNALRLLPSGPADREGRNRSPLHRFRPTPVSAP